MFDEFLIWLNDNVLTDNPKNVTAQKIRKAFSDFCEVTKNNLVSTAGGIYTENISPNSPLPAGVDNKVFLVTQPGTYVNFGNVVLPSNQFGFIFKNGANFTIQSIELPKIAIDGDLILNQTTKAINGDKTVKYIQNKVVVNFDTNFSSGLGYGLGATVFYNDKLYESLKKENKDLPITVVSWREIKLSAIVDTEFNSNSDNAIANSTVTPISDSLFSFLNETVETVLTMPQTGEMSGNVLNISLKEFAVETGSWSTIPMSKLVGFDKIRLSNGLDLLGNNVLWLAKKTKEGTFVNLIQGAHVDAVEIDIDHDAENYIYSRLSLGNVITEFKLISAKPVSEKDSVKKFILENSDQGSLNIGNVIYPEDYGAEAIKNPKNPDDSKDCTSAFNNMFRDLINRTDFFSWKIVMSGIYRIGGAPIYGESNSQLNISFNSVYEWKLRTFVFEGLTMPTMVDGPLQPLNGSGFYSSYVSIDKTKYKYLLALRPNDNFGLNVGHILFDRISVYIKGVNYNQDGTTSYVTNQMGGLNLNNLNTAGFTQLYITNTASGMFMPEPTTSLGLVLPKSNNTGSIYGDKLLVSGFHSGVILTEHASINHLIVVFCKYGVECQMTYPINVNSMNLEMNTVPMIMGSNSCINIGVFQTEDVNDVSKWFNRTDNHIKGVGNSRVVIGQVSCHVWGGSSVNLSVDANVKYRYLMDESGNARLN